MNHLSAFLIALAVLGGCVATSPVTFTQTDYSYTQTPTDPKAIKVYMDKKPEGEYQEIGILSVDDYFGQFPKVIAALRTEAATVGATGIIMHSPQEKEHTNTFTDQKSNWTVWRATAIIEH